MIMRLSSDDNLCTRSASLATFHQDEKQTFVTKQESGTATRSA
jgi:hypothetical protein